MLRDLTMIFSVLLSTVSVMFGLYKHIEAGNAKGFAYEQAYRIVGTIERANIGASAKANLSAAALRQIGEPPPVIDLSRSRADEPASGSSCTASRQDACRVLARQLGAVNDACRAAADAACVAAVPLTNAVTEQGCTACFAR